MDTKTKNIIYAAIAIVVIIFIAYFINKGTNYSPNENNNASSTDNATTTVTTGTSGQVTSTPRAGGSVATPGVPNLEDNAVLATVIGNSFIHVPQTGSDVTLTSGSAKYSDSNGRVTGSVSAGRILGFAKTEIGYDVFTDMTVIKDGQPQILHYVALFHVTSPTNAKYTSSVLIGDRLPIISVVASPDNSKQVSPSKTVMNSALGYLLTINYLDRKNAEPITATPSLAKSITVNVKNHTVSK